MSKVTIIGNDLAKRVFQLHGARHDGSVVFRKKLSRGQLLAFISLHPGRCRAYECCLSLRINPTAVDRSASSRIPDANRRKSKQTAVDISFR